MKGVVFLHRKIIFADNGTFQANIQFAIFRKFWKFKQDRFTEWGRNFQRFDLSFIIFFISEKEVSRHIENKISLHLHVNLTNTYTLFKLITSNSASDLRFKDSLTTNIWMSGVMSSDVSKSWNFSDRHRSRETHIEPFAQKWLSYIPGGTPRKIGLGCAVPFPEPLLYLWPKSAIFPTLFMTWPKIWNHVYDLTVKPCFRPAL